MEAPRTASRQLEKVGLTTSRLLQEGKNQLAAEFRSPNGGGIRLDASAQFDLVDDSSNVWWSQIKRYNAKAQPFMPFAVSVDGDLVQTGLVSIRQISHPRLREVVMTAKLAFDNYAMLVEAEHQELELRAAAGQVARDAARRRKKKQGLDNL